MTPTIEPPLMKRLKPRFQFRFGLKSLFVVMTILCVWLGYTVARNRKADEMIDRHNELLDRIIKNIATPPANTFYRLNNPGSEDELARQLGRSWPGDNFQRLAILRTGTNASTAIQNLTLDISGIKRDEIGQQLIEHYSQRLEALKLKRTITDFVGPTSTAVWTSQSNELTVVIDAHLEPDAQMANIRILLIDSQHLKLW